MLREEQIDIRRQRAVEGQFAHPEPRPQPRLQRLPGHQPDDRRAVPRQHSRLRRGRQHLRLPRLPHQHARHLQAHRGRPGLAARRDAAAAAPPQGRRHPPGDLSCTTASSCAWPASAAAPLRQAAARWPTPSSTTRASGRAATRYERADRGGRDGAGAGDDLLRRDGVHRARDRTPRDGRARTASSSRQLEAGTLELNLLKVPLYPYQMRGALFAACRGRCILGDDMGLGKTVQTLAAVELLAQRTRHRARAGRRAGVGQVSVGDAKSASSPAGRCR